MLKGALDKYNIIPQHFSNQISSRYRIMVPEKCSGQKYMDGARHTPDRHLDYLVSSRTKFRQDKKSWDFLYHYFRSVGVGNDCMLNFRYRIVSNKRPGGVAIFQKGDVYKRQVFNAKMQCLSLFTMTRRREI